MSAKTTAQQRNDPRRCPACVSPTGVGSTASTLTETRCDKTYPLLELLVSA